MKWLMLIGVCTMVLILAGAAASPAFCSTRGEARAVQPTGKSRQRPAVRPGRDLVRIDVTADLRGVWMHDRPATLGGYVASLRFDPQRVRVESVAGGHAPGFHATPVHTEIERANGNGRLMLAHGHTQPGTAGLVNVARVVFRELEPGGAEWIEVRFESLSTPMPEDGSLEMRIPIGE